VSILILFNALQTPLARSKDIRTSKVNDNSFSTMSFADHRRKVDVMPVKEQVPGTPVQVIFLNITSGSLPK